jgi:SAM-dependent methyltransferase
MTVRKVPDAPRLIEWTGERCVPWAPDPPVIYEHYHRYLFASSLVRGRNVLDLASGEGFGAALLAQSALSVTGVDVDQKSVEHSRGNYSAENLDFSVADARELSEFEPGSFGAVVAFELIEHLAEHDRLLAAIERVLTPDGILIISSPDRMAYSEERGFQNPFHVRELTLEELLSLLRSRFANVRAWGQRLATGSTMWPISDPASDVEPAQRFVIERAGDDWRPEAAITPMYAIAVASNGELPDSPPMSWLVDAGDELLHAFERAKTSELAIGNQLGATQAEVRALHDALTNERGALAHERDALANERRLIAVMEDRAAGDEQTIAKLQSELAECRSAIEESVTWQLFQRARRVVYGVLGGRDTALAKLLQKALRGVGRAVR